MTLEGARRGGRAGLLGGLAAVATMYVAALLTGLRALPDVLQQPILALMPGPVFGFLIDNLQHAGKVLEEAGILVLLEAGAVAPGGVFGLLGPPPPFPHLVPAGGRLGGGQRDPGPVPALG